jgi:23S rRNA pseudouridine2605 synthase
MGTKVDPLTDEVCVDGKPVKLSDGNVYLMLNKPAGYLTTMDDPQGRPIVAELVPTERYPGLFPVGRLDFDTTGLLLFTTDGELAFRLLHPRHHVSKRYIATVDGVFSEQDAEQLRKGVELNDGMTLPATVEILTPGGDPQLNAHHLKQHKKLNTNERIELACGTLPKVETEVAITITEGRKRQVKRMFAHVGRPVVALHRESLGALQLKDLPEGQFRALTPSELKNLKQATDI